MFRGFIIIMNIIACSVADTSTCIVPLRKSALLLNAAFMSTVFSAGSLYFPTSVLFERFLYSVSTFLAQVG
jgi:hypothetical protein